MTAVRYLVVTEGAEPATAEPVIATSDPRLVAAALKAMFGAVRERRSPALPRPRPVRPSAPEMRIP